jgi:hypothetical protein
MQDRDAQLQKVIDRQQIEGAIYRYARGVDRCDSELLLSAFWEDGRFIGGPIDGKVYELGPLMVANMKKRFSTTSHLFGNIHIDFTEAGAESESYAIAYHRTLPERESIEAYLGPDFLLETRGSAEQSYDVLFGARYLDQWAQRGGTWKILSRRIVPDWNQIMPSSMRNSGGIFDRLQLRPTRDRTDASYIWEGLPK